VGDGRTTRGLGEGRGSQPRRAGGDGVGGRCGSRGARGGEGPGGLPCGTLGAAAPWPGVMDPGGGRAWPAGQAGYAALVARAARGCEARPAQRRGGGAGRVRSPPRRRGGGRAENWGGAREPERNEGGLGRKEESR
jgi:hypothetical protein